MGRLGAEVEELEERVVRAEVLGEPRENSYLEYRRSTAEAEVVVGELLRRLGTVRTSSTFPGHCRCADQGKPS